MTFCNGWRFEMTNQTLTVPREVLVQVSNALTGIKRAWMNEVESSCNATRDVDRAIHILSNLLSAPSEPKPVEITCNDTLRLMNKPYPRTCAMCGLWGPCRNKAQAFLGETP
jgi:hypothetical protein